MNVQIDPLTGLPIISKKEIHHSSSDGGFRGKPLPDQTGNSGKYLTTNGTDPSWATVSGSGDMEASVYDPQGIEDDAFDRANHTGSQTASTISDFDTEVSNNTDVAANTTARHSHANKALLDTYDQTNANITTAITNSHTHSNKTTLDNITAAFTTADETKLDGIEALADVTDATNVDAAGATMNTDTTLAGNGYFLDEDDMASNSATKVPSQQSVKAYVDAQAGGGTVDSVVAGTNIDVDATDPANPVVSVETLTLADISDVTASTAEVNVLDGVTASTAELNLLDGVTSTTAELNYTDGVTSAIQTQLDGKQPLDSDLTTIAGLTATTDNVIQSVGSAWASRTPAQLKTTLALAKADVGLGNVDNTSDATKNSASATLTNKTIDGDDNTLQDIKLESLKATIATRAYLNGAQSISSGAHRKVLLDAESFDTGADFDTVNSRFVAPMTGYYQVNANVRINNLDAAGNVMLVAIYVNGSVYSMSRGYTGATNNDPAATVSDLVFVSSGQYIELYAQHDSATASEALVTGATETFMSIYFVGT